MCIDQKGMLWISGIGGGNVTRFDPNSGKILQTIHLPVKYPTSCVFGGKDLKQLFITTSRHLLTDKQAAKDHDSGLTFLVDVYY